MLTAEPKKFKRLERRKLNRMLSGKRPFTTLVEKQEMTEMVGKLLSTQRTQHRCLVPNPDTGVLMDSYKYGVWSIKTIEVMRDAYLSGGASSALLEYQKLLLEYEAKIKTAHENIAVDKNSVAIII